jgi:hypothetical protein
MRNKKLIAFICLSIGLLAIGAVLIFTPIAGYVLERLPGTPFQNRLLVEKPEITFKRLVADPIPNGVWNIHASGSSTGFMSNVTIEFDLTNEAIPELLSKRSYHRNAQFERDNWEVYETGVAGGYVTYRLSINRAKNSGAFYYYSS